MFVNHLVDDDGIFALSGNVDEQSVECRRVEGGSSVHVHRVIICAGLAELVNQLAVLVSQLIMVKYS